MSIEQRLAALAAEPIGQPRHFTVGRSRNDGRQIYPGISKAALVRFEVEARRRGLSVNALAGIVLETVAADDLFAAVIDVS